MKGMIKILRYNLHFYLLAFGLIITLSIALFFVEGTLLIALQSGLIVSVYFSLASLLSSWYVYDYSGLYKLSYLDDRGIRDDGHFLNIHAGYDETSALLKAKFPIARFDVLDFYNSEKHTERSLRIAKAGRHNSSVSSQSISTEYLNISDNSIDAIFLIFTAHEIRDEQERNRFFVELNRVLKSDGKIVLVEHLRDIPNFLAYGPGFMHFWSRRAWIRAFKSSNLSIIDQRKWTHWITIFILRKNGIAS